MDLDWPRHPLMDELEGETEPLLESFSVCRRTQNTVVSPINTIWLRLAATDSHTGLRCTGGGRGVEACPNAYGICGVGAGGNGAAG